jgi:parallel beta-helix repeat protein
MTINLSASLGVLPAISRDVDIIANGSVIVDGSNILSAEYCLGISNGAATIAGLELRRCQYGIEVFSSNSPRATIRDCYIHDHAHAGIIIDNQPFQMVGPGNDLARNGEVGIIVYRSASGSTVVRGNYIHENAEVGIALYSDFSSNDGPDNTLIELNVISRNTSGIYLIQNSDNNTIRHNTIAYNQPNYGLTIQNNTCNGNDVRNNIFVGSGTYGIIPGASNVANLDYNLFYSNGTADCNDCADQPYSVYQDPQFVSVDRDDFRLRRNSPAINRGIDIGADVNGTYSGKYNGNAPDIGAFESP